MEIDPRSYHLMYGHWNDADAYHVWDCGQGVTANQAVSDGSGHLLGSFGDYDTASHAMHEAGQSVALSDGEERAYLILIHAPEHPRVKERGNSGTADPHTVVGGA